MRHDSHTKLAKKLGSPLLGQVALNDSDPFSKLNKQDATSTSLSATAAVAAVNQPTQTVKKEEKIHISKLCKKLRKMTNQELETLLASEDDLIIDCLIGSNPTIRKLTNERDELQQEVSDLAKFNYAREPELARDRMKLRDIMNGVIPLKQRITSGHAPRLLNKFTKAENELSNETSRCEEASEVIANSFLVGKKDYDTFLDDYIKLRTTAHQKRILTDKLIKFRSALVDNLNVSVQPTLKSDHPIPTPRQRKRVSFHG